MADDKKSSSFIPDRRVSLDQVRKSIGKGPKGLFTMPTDDTKPSPSFSIPRRKAPAKKTLDSIKKELVQKISDGTVTVGDFLAAAKLENPKVRGFDSLSNELPDAGIPLTMPWTEFSTPETIKPLLADEAPTSSETFVKLQQIEKFTTKFYISNKNLIEEPEAYPFTKEEGKLITGEDGIARSFGPKTENPKAYQKRRSKKLKKVPRADITVPKLIEATKNIPDPETRAAVAFNLLVPYRPGEVASLKISDIDLEAGLVSAYNRGNKTRTELFLPEVALELLRDQVQKAQEEGREEVFDTSVNKMTSALTVKGGLKDLLKENKATLGRELRGVSDLRKIVPSLLAKELGADAALVSSILGHAEGADGLLAILDNVTSRHYVSAVEDVATDPKKHALNVIQHMLASNIGAITLNELPSALGVNASRLTSEDAMAIETVQRTVDASMAPSAQVAREMTPEEKDLLKARTKATVAKQGELEARALLNKTQSELENVRLERELFKEKSDPEYIREQAELNEKRRLARLEARGQTPEATQELLGAPEIPRESTEYDYSREIKAGLTTPEDVEVFRSKSETEQARIIADFQPQLREFKKSELLKKIAKGVKTVAPFLVGGTAGLVAKGAEAAVDIALDAGPAGVEEKDLETQQLMESLKTGMAAPGSPQLFVNRDATEKELTDRMQRELAGLQREAMIKSAREKSRQTFRPTREELINKIRGKSPSFAQQRSEMVQEAEDKFKKKPITQEYEAYFANKPN